MPNGKSSYSLLTTKNLKIWQIVEISKNKSVLSSDN